MPKRMLFVFGTRPEVIKMAPVIELARQHKSRLDPVVCVTAQHRYLLDQALAEFRIKPDIDLNLMKPDQSLYDIISSVIYGMRKVYREIRPDLVFIQGDTSTVFAAALAAYYENIDVAHVEAGLRSGDDRNPFPEEINRKFVSLIARYNFCPTESAKSNLLSEGVDRKKIFVTGNTIIDALKNTLTFIGAKQLQIRGLGRNFFDNPYVLITGHRRENFEKGMKQICETIKSLAKRYEGVNWLWVAHLNPNVRKVVFGILRSLPNVKVVEPLPYSEFVYLMSRSEFIISDSGGVQEEAPYLEKMVLVTRICTERPEALKAGRSILVGADHAKILRNANRLLKYRRKPPLVKNLFGDGLAAKRILDVVLKGRCREFKSGVVHLR